MKKLVVAVFLVFYFAAPSHAVDEKALASPLKAVQAEKKGKTDQ